MDLDVLIVGGGIHGVGILHDLASRGLKNVVLTEIHELACGTSSRSTKLIHGGLRYLEHMSSWSLVRSALSERANLLRLLKDFVQPIPLLMPIDATGRHPAVLRAGMLLYDLLSAGGTLPSSQFVSKNDIPKYLPFLNSDYLSRLHKGAYLFYDAQMRDDVIVRLVARAALLLGTQVFEHSEAIKVVPKGGGFDFVLKNTRTGVEQEGHARFVVNCTGAWANASLLKWHIKPKMRQLLNSGSHFLYAKQEKASSDSFQGVTAGAFLQNADGRVLFFVPWQKRWLFGTTEGLLSQTDPRGLKVSASDRLYLEDASRLFLSSEFWTNGPIDVFTGVRSVPLESLSESPSDMFSQEWSTKPFLSPFYATQFSKNLSSVSREICIDETLPNLLSIYGGKYTTYRLQSESIAARVCRSLGIGGTSKTLDQSNWFLDSLSALEKETLCEVNTKLWRV